jgi:ParB family transcriptional regulator, chromosome partitioning protein
MASNSKQVLLAKIDDDPTYLITTTAGGLEPSLAAVGLINPPILIQKQKIFQIVSGFRRIAAARKLGWSKIEANILDSGLPVLAYARIAVAANTAQRQLNLIEMSRALNLLEKNLPSGQQLSEITSEIGLPGNSAYIAKVIPLCHYAESLQSAIINGRVEVAMASRLNEKSNDERDALIHLFEALQLNLNQQREALVLVSEIAKREDITICDVLSLNIIKDVMNDDNQEQPQKRRKILEALKRRRFPAICSAEDDFSHHLRQLKLGPNIMLLPPKNFESTNYTLRLMFQNTAELKKCHQTLARIIDNPDLQAILARKKP